MRQREGGENLLQGEGGVREEPPCLPGNFVAKNSDLFCSLGHREKSFSLNMIFLDDD